jgi:nucleoside-diphosphate-sugar epimerase
LYTIDQEKLLKVRVELKNRALLVTGGNGALGISLAYCLKHFQITPSCIIITTRNSALDSSWHKIETPIKHISGLNDQRIIEIIHEEVNKLNHEYILLQMAGYGQPKRFLDQPAEIVEANSQLLLSILESSRTPQVVAYMSTAEIYSGYEIEVNEDYPCILKTNHPRATYVFSKLLGESLVSSWGIRHKARTASYRVALAFPPKLIPNDTRVLGELLTRAIKTRQVVLNGGAHLFRQYQYGPNAMIQILSSLINGKESVYNIAGEHQIFLGDLARLIGEITNSDICIANTVHDQSSAQTMKINYDTVNRDAGIVTGSNRTLKHYLQEVIHETTNS